MRPVLLGVDVGGTFTDAVVAAGGRLITGKAPTTPHDQSVGVLAAVRAALERAGAAPDEVSAFAHGTTVATNALLEGKGARTVLVATAGFEDVVELGRQARADLYRLCVAHPPPLDCMTAGSGSPASLARSTSRRRYARRSGEMAASTSVVAARSNSRKVPTASWLSETCTSGSRSASASPSARSCCGWR